MLWNCLHERCFKLYISFNRRETGSARKISLPFSFVGASRKKSVHISRNSRNAEVKLCNLYQFAEAFNGIASCKIFCPSFMFPQFTINCIWLMHFLHELKQVLVLVKQFTSVSLKNVSIKQTNMVHHFLSVTHISHIWLCTRTCWGPLWWGIWARAP